jgi:hypothetical protein
MAVAVAALVMIWFMPETNRRSMQPEHHGHVIQAHSQDWSGPSVRQPQRVGADGGM